MKKCVNVWFDEKDLAIIDAEAKREHLTRTDYIRRGIGVRCPALAAKWKQQYRDMLAARYLADFDFSVDYSKKGLK